MAQEHEIRAWVNPGAWDDQTEAERVITAIMESGSDDEAEWVRIAGGGPEDTLTAAARDYDGAGERLDDARERLTEAIREAIASGLSAYRVAKITGLSERHVGRLRTDAR